MKRLEKYPNYSIAEDGAVYSHIRNKFLASRLNRGGYRYTAFGKSWSYLG